MRLISIIALVALVLTPRPAAVAAFAPIDIVSYGPLDSSSGWVLTSDGFYLTRDEGRSWQDIMPQPGDARLLAADLLCDGNGWVVAERAETADRPGLALATTSDFGGGWRWTDLSLSSPDEPGLAIAELALDLRSATAATLQARHPSSSNFDRRSEWRTDDGGETWTVFGAPQVASGGTSDMAAAGDVYLPNGSDGWRLERRGTCTASGASRICDQEAVLQVTDDGGETWRDLPLPGEIDRVQRTVVPDARDATATAAGAAIGSRTMIGLGQGFDKCEVPTLDELRDWRWNSPYSAVNLYIGGALRACDNGSLNPGYVRSIHDIGWSFIPTWVGPQAPCSGFRSRISYDLGTAQSQGWAEASFAADALRWLGLTEADGTGSIVYYDMEAYNTADGVCNAAVRSFISGWSNGLRARGHLSGVYGLGPTLGLFASLPQPPDAIWPAHWIYNSFNPAASVWNVYRLGNDVWTNQQRLRQYTGGHRENWGNVAMDIDSNVLNGPVAVAAPIDWTPTPTATVTPSATPTRTSTPAPFTPVAWIYLPLLVQR